MAMGQAIDKCSCCGKVGPTSDNDLCGSCEAFRVGGQLGRELHAAGVESFEVDLSGAAELGLVGILDHSTGDIIGSGVTEAEAFRDAIETAKGWAS